MTTRGEPVASGAAEARGRRPGEPVGTWAAPPTTVPSAALRTLRDETVRHVVHTSVGGDALRIRLTNEFGEQPLRIGEVHVARRAGSGASSDAVPGTDRRVSFGGQTAVQIPAGSPLVSDAIDLHIPDGADLVISLYLPEPTPVTTLFSFALQDNVIAAGNVTGAPTVHPTETIGQIAFLSGVSVVAAATAVVALGDSITNGAHTPNNVNHRWPDLFAQRLRGAGLRHGVLNVGISGNRLLRDPHPPAGSPAETYAPFFGQSGLRRFDRDVLAQPGVADVIVLLGVNDLGHPGTVAPVGEAVSGAELIAGHGQLITRAHEAGLRIFGGTVLPFRGDTIGFFTADNERKRSELNRWIRTGGEYDGVVDFDHAMRDPADPLRLNPAYDSGDGLHPNQAGMAAMAAAVPLELFR